MDEARADLQQASFSWVAILERQRAAGRPFVELMRTGSLSTGLYVLPAGAVDAQVPHTEDEVYIVIAGGALFTSGMETREVRAGDVLFVAAAVPHRFHDISEELRAIVVFAPPEGSMSGPPPERSAALPPPPAGPSAGEIAS
jgi:mannose-6-phosphate isomerase-like protein (cupin superfamily)